MHSYRTGAFWATPFFLVLLLGSTTPLRGAQGSPAPDRARKSVRGTLQSVDKGEGGVIMKSDAGERLAWRFSPAVIAEIAKLAPGAPMIVIYRQISSNEKRVTAIAFPGTASTPTYVNVTGSRVVLRSAPAVADACGRTDAGPVSESTIPAGGRAEVMDACWCCAPAGKACTPGNKSGQGQAFLEHCFE